MKKQALYFAIISLGVLSVLWCGYTTYTQNTAIKEANIAREKLLAENLKKIQTAEQPGKIDNIQGIEYVYWPRNFSFNILPEWKQISVEEAQIPKEFENPQFIFQKKNSSCVMSYLNYATSTEDEFQQIYFAQRVFTYENEQVDSSYWLRKNYIPKNFTFDFENEQPLPREVRIVNYPNSWEHRPRYIFVLFSSDGGVVSKDCDRDYSLMVASLAPKYKTESITRNSTGIIYLKNGVITSERGQTFIYFRRDEDGLSRYVSKIDRDETQPQVYGGLMYYTQKGDLYSFNFLTSESRRILDKSIPDGQVVNNFYIINGSIYYLLGNGNCNEYRGLCDNSLWKYTLTGNHSVKLAENLPYRLILGYDEEKKVLHLAYSDGDAGCFSADTAIYDFSLRKVVQGKTYSGCSDDTGTDTKEYVTYFEQFKTQTFNKNFIQIKNGDILAPNNAVVTPVSGWKSIKYVSGNIISD